MYKTIVYALLMVKAVFGGANDCYQTLPFPSFIQKAAGDNTNDRWQVVEFALINAATQIAFLGGYYTHDPLFWANTQDGANATPVVAGFSTLQLRYLWFKRLIDSEGWYGSVETIGLSSDSSTLIVSGMSKVSSDNRRFLYFLDPQTGVSKRDAILLTLQSQFQQQGRQHLVTSVPNKIYMTGRSTNSVGSLNDLMQFIRIDYSTGNLDFYKTNKGYSGQITSLFALASTSGTERLLLGGGFARTRVEPAEYVISIMQYYASSNSFISVDVKFVNRQPHTDPKTYQTLVLLTTDADTICGVSENMDRSQPSTDSLLFVQKCKASFSQIEVAKTWWFRQTGTQYADARVLEITICRQDNEIKGISFSESNQQAFAWHISAVSTQTSRLLADQFYKGKNHFTSAVFLSAALSVTGASLSKIESHLLAGYSQIDLTIQNGWASSSETPFIIDPAQSSCVPMQISAITSGLTLEKQQTGFTGTLLNFSPFSSLADSLSATFSTLSFRSDDLIHAKRTAAVKNFCETVHTTNYLTQAKADTTPITLYPQVLYTSNVGKSTSCAITSFSITGSNCAKYNFRYEYGIEYTGANIPVQDIVHFDTKNSLLIFSLRENIFSRNIYKVKLWASLPDPIIQSASFDVHVVEGTGTDICLTALYVCAQSPLTYVLSTIQVITPKTYNVGDAQISIAIDDFGVSPDLFCTYADVKFSISTTGGPNSAIFTLYSSYTALTNSWNLAVKVYSVNSADAGVYSVSISAQIVTPQPTAPVSLVFEVTVVGSCPYDISATFVKTNDIPTITYPVTRAIETYILPYTLNSLYCTFADVVISFSISPSTSIIQALSTTSLTYFTDQVSDIKTYTITVSLKLNNAVLKFPAATFNVVPMSCAYVSPLTISTTQSIGDAQYRIGDITNWRTFSQFTVTPSDHCTEDDVVYTLSVVTDPGFVVFQIKQNQLLSGTYQDFVQWTTQDPAFIGQHQIIITPTLPAATYANDHGTLTATQLTFMVEIMATCSQDTNIVLTSSQIIPNSVYYVNQPTVVIDLTPYTVTSTYSICVETDVTYSVTHAATTLSLFDLNNSARTLSWYTANYLDQRVYTVTFSGQIVDINGLVYSFDLPSFTVEIASNCFYSLDPITLQSAGCSIPNIQYVLKMPTLVYSFPKATETTSVYCEDSDIVYRLSGTPSVPSFLSINQAEHQLSIFTEDVTFDGVYDLTLQGVIDTQYQGTRVPSAQCSFQLQVIEDLCKTSQTTLDTSMIESYEYKIGSGPTRFNLFLADNAEGQCWPTWTYKLFIDGKNQIEITDKSFFLDPQLTFSSNSLFIQVETDTLAEKYYDLLLVASKANNPNFAEKAFKLSLVIVPNNAPYFVNGYLYNNTLLNVTEQVTTGGTKANLYLGQSFDVEQDLYSCEISLIPSFYAELFRLDCISGKIEYEWQSLMNLRTNYSSMSIKANVSIVDENKYPAGNRYYIDFFLMTLPSDYNLTDNQTADSGIEASLAEKKWKYDLTFVDLQITDNGYATVYFSEPILIPEKFDIPEDLIFRVELLPQSDYYEADRYELSWRIDMITRAFLRIELVFVHPLYISNFYDIKDQLRVTALKESQLAIRAASSTEEKYVTFAEGHSIKAAVKRQLPGKKEDIAELKENSQSLGQATNAIVAGSFVLNILMGGAISLLWGLVNTLQMVTHLVYLNVLVPENAVILNNVLMNASNLDLIKLDYVYEALFPFLYFMEDSDGRSLQESSESEIESPLSQLGNFCLTFIMLLALIPVIFMLKLGKFSQKTIMRIQSMVFWSGTLQLLIEAYLEVMLSCANAFKNGLKWISINGSIASLFVYTCFVVLTLAPMIITLFLICNFRQFRQQSFRQRYKAAITELNYRTCWSPLYLASFCYRRLFFIIILVFFTKSQALQVVWVCVSEVFGIMLFGIVRPMNLPTMRRMEYFNSAMLVLCIYHYFCFTEFAATPEARYTIGKSLIYVTLFILFVNIGLMFSVMLKTALFKMKVLRVKFKRAFSKNSRRAKEMSKKKDDSPTLPKSILKPSSMTVDKPSSMTVDTNTSLHHNIESRLQSSQSLPKRLQTKVEFKARPKQSFQNSVELGSDTLLVRRRNPYFTELRQDLAYSRNSLFQVQMSELKISESSSSESSSSEDSAPDDLFNHTTTVKSQLRKFATKPTRSRGSNLQQVQRKVPLHEQETQKISMLTRQPGQQESTALNNLFQIREEAELEELHQNINAQLEDVWKDYFAQPKVQKSGRKPQFSNQLLITPTRF